MNYRSQLLPLLTADFRLSAMTKNRCDVPVQEHRRKLCGVARHDPRMERGRGTARIGVGTAESLHSAHSAHSACLQGMVRLLIRALLSWRISELCCGKIPLLI